MDPENVRIFDIKYSRKDIELIKTYFDQVLDEAFLTSHTFCNKLEKAFERLCKPFRALSCSSATSGLEAVFRFIDIQEKAVLVQSNTFIATGHAIQAAGGIIVPIDLDQEYIVSFEDVQNCIQECKQKGLEIGAICIVNIAGRASKQLIKIQKLCNENKIPLVEDNAQGMLSTLDNAQLGTFSDFSVSSFQTTKVVASGQGGLILVKEEKNYEGLKNFLFYGKDPSQPLLFSNISGNYKMSELNAALALADYERSKKRIARRREIDSIYKNFVSNEKYYQYLACPKFNKPSYYKTIFMVKDPIFRNALEDFFKENNISMTGYVYKIPLHLQPRIFNSSKFIKRNLKNTEDFSNCHFTPPNYPELTDEKVHYVCKKLNQFQL